MGGCGCNSGQKASKLFNDCGCGCKGKKQEHKLIISIMSALIFFVVANPETFRVMRGVVGGWVSSPTGCPTIKGLALHTVVFMLVVWGLMNIRREGEEKAPVDEQMATKNAGAVANAVADAADGVDPILPPPATDDGSATSPPTDAPNMEELLKTMNGDGQQQMPPSQAEVNIQTTNETTLVAPPPMPGMENTNNMGSDEDYEENTLAPYSPIENGDPSMDKMAGTATGGAQSMSQKMGGPVPTTQPQDTLRMGNYMQCKCGDGSHVMLMK
jgi:hypothetical protein